MGVDRPDRTCFFQPSTYSFGALWDLGSFHPLPPIFPSPAEGPKVLIRRMSFTSIPPCAMREFFGENTWGNVGFHGSKKSPPGVSCFQKEWNQMPCFDKDFKIFVWNKYCTYYFCSYADCKKKFDSMRHHDISLEFPGTSIRWFGMIALRWCGKKC